MILQAKKGAMFGIDARIALAIFAMVSVLGAYNSFYKIGKAQDASLVTQVNILRDAARQNIADNGLDYNISGANLNDNIFGIYDSSGSGGLNMGKNNQSYIKQIDASPTDGTGFIQTADSTINYDNKYLYSTTDFSTFATTDCVNTSATCYYFIKFMNVDEDSFSLLNEYFDADTTTTYSSAIANLTEGLVVAHNIVTDIADVYVKVGER